MCNKEHLVGYLYNDLSATDRAAFDAHAEACADCRHELRQLQQTRQHLASWAPPEPAFDIRVAPRAEPAPPRRFPFVPAWGLAAAATLLVLAGAAAIANLEVRLGSDGLVVRTGWAAPGDAHGASVPTTASTAAAPEWTGDLRALEARLRELEQARTAAADGTPAPTPVSAAPGSAANEAIATAAVDALEARLRRVIADSEARQRRELALQISTVWKDFNAVRASDFVRVQGSLDRVQGQTNDQLRLHRDSIQSLYRVSLQR